MRTHLDSTRHHQETAAELARATFKPSDKAQFKKAKTYIPLLSILYREGTAPVQILGLQRVGYNDRLVDVLDRARNKRERAAMASRASLLEMLGGTASAPGKRTAAEMEMDAAGGHSENGQQGSLDGEPPSKLPRVTASAWSMDEELVLTGTEMAWGEM